MDITPHRLGASINHRAEALQLLDLIADEFAHRETYIGQLLLKLADAREARAELIANPGVDRPVGVIEDAELNVQAARDALAAALPGPIETVLTESACRRQAEELWQAAERSVTAIAEAKRLAQLITFPNQRGQEDAA
jgi:hypothetical protein